MQFFKSKKMTSFPRDRNYIDDVTHQPIKKLSGAEERLKTASKRKSTDRKMLQKFFMQQNNTYAVSRYINCNPKQTV